MLCVILHLGVKLLVKPYINNNNYTQTCHINIPSSEDEDEADCDVEITGLQNLQ